MIPVLLSVAATISVGLPLAALFFPTATRMMLLALSFLYGSAAVFLALLALSTAGIPWSAPVVAATLLVIAGVAIVAITRRSAHAGAQALPRVLSGERWHAAPFDLMTLILLTGFALFATLAPLSEWDFWAIWGLKARVFLENGGIDWRFLESPLNLFSHPDYPPLLPLNYDFVALLNRGWDDRWLGLLFVAFAGSLLLLARELFLDDLPRGYAALGTLIMASAACSHFVGLAETPLIVFSAGGILLIRRAMRDGNRISFRNGSALLGLAGCCKNEGLAMIVSVAIAFLVVGRRDLRRLIDFWPALALPLPWLVLRAIHYLPTDLATGSVLGRAVGRLPQIHVLLLTLGSKITYRRFWIALVAAWVVIAVGQAFARRTTNNRPLITPPDRFVMTAMAIQMTIYIATYLVTPADVLWHIGTSWSRVSEQIAAPLIYVTVVMLGRMIRMETAGRPKVLETPKPIENESDIRKLTELRGLIDRQ